MDKKDSRYYLNLPYPENLIRTVCADDAEIIEDRIIGLQHSLVTMMDRELEVLELRFRERKTYREIAGLFGIPEEKVRVIYERTLRKLRKSYRFPLILLGYNASRQAEEQAKRAERREDEEAFEKAVEEIGNPGLLTMPVRKMGLPVIVENALARDGIVMIKDLWILKARHPKAYDCLHEIGETRRKEIEDRLRRLGFILKGGTENG